MKQGPYTELGPKDAALVAIEAESELHSLDLPDGLSSRFLYAIDEALARRASNGFQTDPTKEVEVGGLVRAIMGPYGHLRHEGKILRHYVVGRTQTTPDILELARSAVLNSDSEAIK